MFLSPLLWREALSWASWGHTVRVPWTWLLSSQGPGCWRSPPNVSKSPLVEVLTLVTRFCVGPGHVIQRAQTFAIPGQHSRLSDGSWAKPQSAMGHGHRESLPKGFRVPFWRLGLALAGQGRSMEGDRGMLQNFLSPSLERGTSLGLLGTPWERSLGPATTVLHDAQLSNMLPENFSKSSLCLGCRPCLAKEAWAWQ